MGLRIYSGENNRVLHTNGQPLCTRMRALARAAAQRPERYLFVQRAILLKALRQSMLISAMHVSV